MRKWPRERCFLYATKSATGPKHWICCFRIYGLYAPNVARGLLTYCKERVCLVVWQESRQCRSLRNSTLAVYVAILEKCARYTGWVQTKEWSIPESPTPTTAHCPCNAYFWVDVLVSFAVPHPRRKSVFWQIGEVWNLFLNMPREVLRDIGHIGYHFGSEKCILTRFDA